MDNFNEYDKQWTSIEAEENSEHIRESASNRIYAFLKEQGTHGATDQELEDALGIPGNTERPSRLGLVKGGHVKATKRWRYTRAHFRAIVWVAIKPSKKKSPTSP
jgi:hypothetical protein